MKHMRENNEFKRNVNCIERIVGYKNWKTEDESIVRRKNVAFQFFYF